MPQRDRGRPAESRVEKENGKWLGYEGNMTDTLYVQLKKEIANPLNKLTVVIVSLSAISFLMTDDSIAVSMPHISMAGLGGVHRRFQISLKIKGQSRHWPRHTDSLQLRLCATQAQFITRNQTSGNCRYAVSSGCFLSRDILCRKW
jgi:hypothetical protein